MAGPGLEALQAGLRGWLFDAALPLWASVGRNDATGGFEEAIGLDGRALDAPLRARVQARQVYVYALAGSFGWEGPWREAVEGGLGFIGRYRRPDGLYRTRVSREGAPVDDAAILYDQAFFLFARAAAAAALPERRAELEREALAHLDAVEVRFGYAGAGFRENDAVRPFQSNPHMHLFEAAMAWSELPRDPGGGQARWRGLADRIAELCLDRFVDAQTGALREVFDADWRPAPGADGRIVEPGHQFEWAWLLKRWADARGEPRAETAARRLHAIGVEHGVDARRGVAFNALDDRFRPLDPVARLWPQTERIKAGVALGAGEAEVAAAVRGLRLYLDAAPGGLWRDRLQPDGLWVDEPAPASSFYHIACALQVLWG